VLLIRKSSGEAPDMAHTSPSAFAEVNEKVAQAGEILKLKPGCSIRA
jgi:hypothetical protein